MTEQQGLRTQGELGDEVGSIQWIWPFWIPRRYVTLLVGQPGVGKSMVAQLFAECVCGARAWPDGYKSEAIGTSSARSKTLVIDTEGCSAVYGIRCKEMNLTPDAMVFPPESSHSPLSEASLSSLNLYIQAEQSIQLIVLDSLRGAHSGDENNSEIAAAVMNKLTELAQKHSVGVLAIHHLRKKNEQILRNIIETDHVRGSTAYIQFARSVIALNKPTADGDILHLSHIKSNFSETQPTIGLKITETGIEVCELPPDPRRRLQIETAQEFLRSRLKSGPVLVAQLEQEAKKVGVSRATLYRASNTLVEAIRQDGKTCWHLPGQRVRDMRQENNEGGETVETHEKRETGETTVAPSQPSHVSGDAPKPSQ